MGLAPGGLWAPQWPLLPRGWVAVLLTFLPLLTASSDNSELTSPSTARQVASGLSHPSLAYESSRPSTITQAPLGPFHSSPVPESSSRSRHPGPDRIRHRLRLQRRAQKPYSRPGNHRGTSRVPAPSADSSPSTACQMTLGLFLAALAPKRSSSSSARQAASGLSRGTLALESSSRSSHPGPDRVPHHSQLHRGAQKPYSLPGRSCETSCVPAPSAESSTFGTASQLAWGPSCASPALESSSPSTASQVALGLFQGSPAPARSSCSTAIQAPLGPSHSSPVPESSSCSRHPGPDRIRHRLRLQRQAQKPYSRPGRRC